MGTPKIDNCYLIIISVSSVSGSALAAQMYAAQLTTQQQSMCVDPIEYYDYYSLMICAIILLTILHDESGSGSESSNRLIYQRHSTSPFITSTYPLKYILLEARALQMLRSMFMSCSDAKFSRLILSWRSNNLLLAQE